MLFWGQHGRMRYPAVIVGVDDVPESTMKNLGRNTRDKLLVKCWGEESYPAFLEKNIEPC